MIETGVNSTDPQVLALKRLCDRLGGYDAVAKEIGANGQSIYQIITGRTLPSGNPKGVGPALRAKLTDRFPDWLATNAVAMKPLNDEGDPVDALRIPLLANSASMGPSNDDVDGDVFLGALTVSENWVSREVRPSSPGALRFIHAYGESMAPTFADGDVLLVDTGARDAATIDGIYVLRAHGRLFVKRVRQRLDGNIEISSDNPTVKTVDVLDGSGQVEAMGRVVWVWNGRKL